MEKLKKENSLLKKQCEVYEKQLSAISENPKTEAFLYKIEGGKKFVKAREDSSWELCCKKKSCWRIADDSLCLFHKQSPKGNKKIYYIPLTQRRKKTFICKYTWRYKSSKHLKGDVCSKEAQYVTDDGIFLCTNHVNVYKTNNAVVYRKRDKKELPSELLKSSLTTA